MVEVVKRVALEVMEEVPGPEAQAVKSAQVVGVVKAATADAAATAAAARAV